MNDTRWLALFVLCSIPTSLPAADSTTALLRCDPGLKILSIDGDPKRAVSVEDSARDCNVPLPPGPHVLTMKFEHKDVGDFYFDGRIVSLEDLHVHLDAVAGRTYRLKASFTPAWHAWVDDVTSQEYDAPWTPGLSKKARKAAAKGKPSSILVATLSPRNVVILSYDGRVRAPWFLPEELKGLYIRKKEQVTQDFAMVEVTEGANLGMIEAVINGNAFSLDKQWGYLCDETRAPVFENLAGGKVYYLGRFEFSAIPTGLELRFTQQDLESARASLRKVRPELADALEPAGFRMARIKRACAAVLPGTLWSNSKIDPGVPVSPR